MAAQLFFCRAELAAAPVKHTSHLAGGIVAQLNEPAKPFILVPALKCHASFRNPAPDILVASLRLWDAVIADMRARDKLGKRQYGRRLYSFNGRDALQDAYEECLDMAVYLKQALIEDEKS